MAKALRNYNVTPADELRALLSETEKLAGLPGANAQVVYTLLGNLDRITELWPQLEAAGVDLRPEQGRRQTLEAQIHRLAPRILRHVGAAGLRAERVKRFGEPPSAAPWWWRLDEEVRAARLRSARKTAVIIAGLAVLGFLVITLVNVLFPVDPAVRDAAGAQVQGQADVGNGDYQGALAQFRRAAELTPADPQAQTWYGVAQQKLGDEAGAAKAYAAARALLPNEIEFRVTRAPMYYAYHMRAECEADVETTLALDPEDPRAYFYQASLLEDDGRIAEAGQALQKASQFAEARGNTELMATARYRLGILMQQMPPVPEQTPVGPEQTPAGGG